MNSITTRLIFSASLVLAGFVILTSLSVRHSVHTRAEQALLDRMQGMVYGILGAAELDSQNLLRVNEYELPDQRLTNALPGTYAEVLDPSGKRLWSSPSKVVSIPPLASIDVGEWKFITHAVNDAESVRGLQFATSWLTEDGNEEIFTIQVVDEAVEYTQQLRKFDRNLWLSLLLSAMLLLLVQMLVLAWGLNPLSKIGRGLKRIESGDDELLDTRLPLELKPLANSINTLLGSERNRHLRYRNVMDDLAHSLKTPLSVLANLDLESDNQKNKPENQQILHEQTRRMNDIIAYHLQRANARGSQALAPPLYPLPIIQRLAQSLRKVYPESELRFTPKMKKNFLLRVAESDMMEILGNILENACKYGATDIVVTGTKRDDQLLLVIDDNGPGFPPTEVEHLAERGRRADSTREGQGLGLAVTRELVESYGGELKLGTSPLGGARGSLIFS